MKKAHKKIISGIILLLFPVLLMAQPPHPNGGNIPGPGNEPVGGINTCAPIDGGLSVLLGLGLAYGARYAFRVLREKK